MSKQSGTLKWILVGVAVVGLIVLMRFLPLESYLSPLKNLLDRLGFWGPVLFGVLYITATLLFVPGLIPTIAAGAIFGLWIGVATVSSASTTGASLAFLIARHLAREKVKQLAEEKPKFDAIDSAVKEGGWKIVALLRLSPIVPFNLQNYFYGLTAIGFWGYVLTSWLAMLPGTFMYVYIGHVAGLAANSERQRTTAEWIMIGVGLAATVAVTVYVTHLAKKRLEESDVAEK